ncbi:2Fe-2S iron-sulfur cluster-binding protein [Kineosporia rhizophila]|uniref:2Fe-2S iron-sulfur cluster-binding protein n=1 Tax=Kineosporia TaxID=49184 RepID=UPI001E554562|nr:MULTISPECIES: 2Fe-2S iron-sulfur cluster-binding protein [Kineosporia]MCE0535967.1 2Fe-2S iron-sulfur cluster-binding protein [Kineosporia rhizophila]GLY14203.1 sarcosine oxidase subunit alpha [Kineosporia sp. NBRC 101677]
MTRIRSIGRPLTFSVNGVELPAQEGDTVASALVAADALTVGPSIYRGRPRGLLTADLTEPNALIQADGGEVLPATVVEVTEGMKVRTLSGIGRLEPEPATAFHDKKFVHTDVLVVGAGPAGLAAAMTASAGGARVLLVDDQPAPGGDLGAGDDWITDVTEKFAERRELTVLSRSSVFGYYDQNYLLVLERLPHGGRVWHVRARQVVLATGARQRPLVFENNDRPGIMLASAVRRYLDRYGAVSASRAVVATVEDSAYEVVLDLLAAGVTVAAVVDSRAQPPGALAAAVREAGVDVVPGSVVVGTSGQERLTSVHVRSLAGDGGGREILGDLLAVSGGWNPDLHLFSQSRGELVWDEGLAAFRPGRAVQAVVVAGSANGKLGTWPAIADGADAGYRAAEAVGHPSAPQPLTEFTQDATDTATSPCPVWLPPAVSGEPAGWHNHFVDLHRDVSVADVWRSVGSGMRSLEHVKRYTTAGTGYDQGATAGVNVAGVVAQALGAGPGWPERPGPGSPGDLGTTTFRAPALPVSFAALAGRDLGHLHDPARTTPIHPWHVAAGAEFEDVGQWKRPWFYPRPGEDMHAAVLRECRAARTGVAVMDASTLGKIEIVGKDAPEFLNRVYTNAFAKLAVGSARYGLMCSADGMVLDDGVTMRLAPDRFLMSTTTGGAARVLDWLEEWHQTEWPDLDLTLTSVTEQFSTIAVVGPAARAVIAGLAPGCDVSNEAFPFMTFRETLLANGVPARIARISFSGELAFEVNVAGWYALAVWEAVIAAGAEHDITPYGTETMHVLRAEKGFPIVGQDTDGTVTPHDLGMSWIVSKKKDFVGRRSLNRPDLVRADRKHLVGLLPADPAELLPEGAQLVAEDTDLSRVGQGTPVPMLGHVTSSYHSAALERTFALALIKGGRDRIGERVLAPLGGRVVAATITEPVFYDKEGARRDG